MSDADWTPGREPRSVAASYGDIPDEPIFPLGFIPPLGLFLGLFQLEETTRVSLYHMAEHHPVRSESLQPHTEWSSWPGSAELSSVEADLYIWCYALLVMHARKEEEDLFQWRTFGDK